MKRLREDRVSMTFFFSAMVFCIILCTTALMSGIFFMLLRLGMINGSHGPHLLLPVLSLAVFSTGVGTLLTVWVSRIALHPVRGIIDATRQLADGKFSTRIHLKGPREFEELSNSFNQMAERLGSLEMLRSDFVNNFSHEFKTPIVSLRGYAKLLKNGNLSEEERQEYLDIIISESERLTALAANVLNLSKVEQQSILTGVEAFDLSEQLRRAVLSLESKWNQKQLELSLELDECRYAGNEPMLYQVWLNLLDNAIKFTPAEGKVEIKLVNSAPAVIVTVQDNGCGISENTKSHVFDKFYQGDTSHATEGNGLGLTLCQKIVQLHGGTIHLSGREGHGTCVAVELPQPDKK